MSYANMYITNESGSNGLIQIYHASLTSVKDSKGNNMWVPLAKECNAFPAKDKERVGPFKVEFGTGLGHYTDTDQWWVVLSCYDDPQTGVYHAANFKATMTSNDASHDRDIYVSTSQVSIKLHDGTVKASMHKRHSFGKVANVFVLMLENHSFDNIFGFSGIEGIKVLSPGDYNMYDGNMYAVSDQAPSRMPTDPGHEFQDVFEQLHGNSYDINNYHGGPYPDPNLSGFAMNYATSTTEGPAPKPEDIDKIMAGFQTESKLPVIYTLAKLFAICDSWFSSMPGPTWPNRYFVHGASSAGLDHSPGNVSMAIHESVNGFQYEHGSLFDRLKSYKQDYRIYMDEDGPLSGSVPQVTSLQGLAWHKDTYNFSDFAGHTREYYPATYTFIEPNYGDTAGGGYKGGSSQHPKDSMDRGELLIKKVYEALRNSPLWMSSMLVVTYDEHGGFYDSVPTQPAKPPGDKTMKSENNQWGFAFDRTGLRVPAVVISPWIPAGKVSKDVYDHSSIPATMAKIVGMPTLTNRDAAATTLDGLLSLETPRQNCPLALKGPSRSVALTIESPEEMAAREQRPLPDSGNLAGFLLTALKAELELAPEDERESRIAAFQQIRTYGGARAYLDQVVVMVRDAREAHRQEMMMTPPPAEPVEVE